MEITSEEYKQLFCRTFLNGHQRYEPAQLGWPDLNAETLALLRGLPFWTHALQAEEDAGPMITACAALEPDPLLREALQLQAYEESRHASIIRHMIGLYGLPADNVHVELPADVIEGFIDFGFEECLDSFGAFGLFKLARAHLPVPQPLFDIFDRVMQEEATHIVFFLNWYTYRQASRGGLQRALRHPKALWHYGKALRKLADLARDDDTPAGKDFIVTGASAFVEQLTPRIVIAACLQENARRLAGFDRRLRVPQLAPRLARLALGVIDRVPSARRRENAPPRPAAPATPAETPPLATQEHASLQSAAERGDPSAVHRG